MSKFKFRDTFGDIWVWEGRSDYVVREKDGNIGGWYEGHGLERVSV